MNTENNPWDNLDDYLDWLHNAYELLKQSTFVYDKKQRRRYYNKAYWEYRFKIEIRRIEHTLALERRINIELDKVA